MKRETITAADARRPFELDIDVPSGFHLADRAGTLLYPREIAAVSNWDLSIAKPATSGEDANGWPQLQYMPADGVLLWLVLGDVAQDNEVMPWESGGPLGVPDMTYLAPTGAQAADSRVARRVTALRESDRIGSRWDGVSQWIRVIPLADPSGEAEKEPLYLQIFAFAGSQAGYAAPLANASASLSFSYL